MLLACNIQFTAKNPTASPNNDFIVQKKNITILLISEPAYADICHRTANPPIIIGISTKYNVAKSLFDNLNFLVFLPYHKNPL